MTRYGPVDAATAEVLGLADYLERLQPESAAGRDEAASLRHFGPEQKAEWREEIDALRRVETWLDDADDAPGSVRAALAELPAIETPLRRLDSEATLSEGDFFDLKQFAHYGRRILESAEALVAALDGPADGADRLQELSEEIHPGGEETPRFHLSGELDDRLRETLERTRRLESQLADLRDELGAEVTDAFGGTLALRGRYRPPEDCDPTELREHRYLIERGEDWFLDSDRLGELESKLSEARRELEAAEDRVRSELTDSLRESRERLGRIADFLARLDLRLAKVRLRRQLDGCWGEWGTDSSDRAMEIRVGREPRTAARVDASGGSLQPIDFELGRRPAVVTGPNMGGKSALLVLSGICQWCAQHAIPVPADSFAFEPVASIVYIGSEEPAAVDASRGLSSFGREVRRLVEALDGADRPVLWLFDELGRGTHPDDGAKLAEETLRYVAGRGDRAVAATHFPALAASEDVATHRIRGLDVEALESALSKADDLDAVEAALRGAMDFQPEPASEAEVPHDARRVARALGLDFDGS